MTTITIERGLLEEWLDRFQSSIHAGDTSLAALEAEQMFRSALAAPATAPKHRTVSDDLIACLRGGRQCDADGVEVIMSRQACREAADILESWAIDQAPATAPEQPASKALQDVATERQRQDAKWGGPEHDDTHPISDWQRFISQRAENLVYRGNPERMYELFIEIAALAVAAAESIDRKGTP